MLKMNKSYLLAMITGIVTKVCAIFIGFLIVKALVDMPDKVSTNLSYAMSMIQLVTATIGSAITYLIYKAEMSKNK